MAASTLPLENRPAWLLLRYSGIYLIYLAVVARLYVMVRYDPDALLIAALIGIYGIVLFSGDWLIPRLSWYPAIYLVLQSFLVVVLLRLRPGLDYLPMLFVPPCLQAVLSFGRKIGMLIVGVFIAVYAYLGLSSNPGNLEILMMLPVMAGFLGMMGNYAHLIRKAEAARRENQRLLAELQIANRHLQESAVKAEGLAAMQERSRMARELHDSVTQTIFSMNLTVQAARMLVDKDPDSASGQIERLQELSRSAAGEIKLLSTQIELGLPSEEGLPAALRRLVVERQASDLLHIRLEINGERELNRGVISGLYRITQEALNNVAKHAQTKEATVRLSLTGEHACLDIEDQGLGFDLQKPSESGHIGMAGMAERAAEMGWKLSIDSKPGRGTRVHLEEVRS